MKTSTVQRATGPSYRSPGRRGVRDALEGRQKRTPSQHYCFVTEHGTAVVRLTGKGGAELPRVRRLAGRPGRKKVTRAEREVLKLFERPKATQGLAMALDTPARPEAAPARGETQVFAAIDEANFVPAVA